MSLSQAARPRRFADILGQPAITAALTYQARTHQFHHAYLFAGPSGTGKTTTARVLAMALNCEKGSDGEPCGSCPSCQAILRGASWDVYEFNAALFRRIEDVRDMQAKAYLSSFGRHKVYILDECHMLTEEAWNGLLKLLEEPPPHLVFILATTSGAKLPTTVQSRCQVFSFALLDKEVVTAKLTAIADERHLGLDGAALRFIAATSDGNMRTAENMLEQAMAGLLPMPKLAKAPVMEQRRLIALKAVATRRLRAQMALATQAD